MGSGRPSSHRPVWNECLEIGCLVPNGDAPSRPGGRIRLPNRNQTSSSMRPYVWVADVSASLLGDLSCCCCRSLRRSLCLRRGQELIPAQCPTVFAYLELPQPIDGRLCRCLALSNGICGRDDWQFWDGSLRSHTLIQSLGCQVLHSESLQLCCIGTHCLKFHRNWNCQSNCLRVHRQVTGRNWSGFGFDKVKWTFLLLGGLRNELARKGLLGDLLLFGDLCGVFLYD